MEPTFSSSSRLKLAATASALSGSPLLNFLPVSILTVKTLPSAEKP